MRFPWQREGEDKHPDGKIWTLCASCRKGMILDPAAYNLTVDEVIVAIISSEVIPMCAECLPSNGIAQIEQFLADVWGEGSDA